MPGVAAPSSNPENAHAELACNVPPGVPSPFGPPLPLPVISPAYAALAPAPTTAAAHAATANKRALFIIASLPPGHRRRCPSSRTRYFRHAAEINPLVPPRWGLGLLLGTTG